MLATEQKPPSQMNCRQCHFVCDEIAENLYICPMEGCSQCTLCCICQNEELGNTLNKDLYCKKCKAREGI